MKRVLPILAFFLIYFSVSTYGQVPDSISIQTAKERPLPIDSLPHADISNHAQLPDRADSTTVKKRGFIGRIFKEDYPNPKKALFLSLAVPGAGQLYNKRWWKLPFVYGAYTGLILAIDFNTKNYRRFRDAYIADQNDQPHEFSGTGLDKNKQLSYIGLFALHLVQTAEAFVDCHLRTFDVSDDLSFRVSPKLGALPTGNTYLGIGLTFQFSQP